MLHRAAILSIAALLAGCVSEPKVVYRASVPAQAQNVPANPPPQSPAPTVASPQSGTLFRAPEVMRLPGLEQVIGRSAGQLERRFGKAQLDTLEGDMRKLQFAGEPCVLDVYLYPLQPGSAPTATHVEARRAADGAVVDRASCVRALQR